MNPFSVRKPARSEEFYNRKEEVEIAVEFLRKMQCFSIIGENGIGRTSFLIHILSRKILEKHNIDPEKHVIIYLDLSSLYEPTKDRFIEALVESIEKQTGEAIESGDAPDKLKIYVENLTTVDKKLIFALDEFEIIAPFLDDQLSHWLRYIFQRPNVMAITAGRKTIRELEKSGEFASPLYNIFSKFQLGLFPREETENIIQEMFQKEGIEPNKEKVSFMADLSGGNPYLISLLRFYYDKGMSKKELRNKVSEQARDQFEGYWDLLLEEEKEFISHIKSAKNDSIGDDLRKRGFLIRRNGKLEIFSPLFGKFVNLKVQHSQKRENFIFILLSMLISAFLLMIWGEHIPAIEGFLGISLKKLNMNVHIIQLVIFIILFIILFLLFKRIEKILASREVKFSQILSEHKILFSVFLVLISLSIFITLNIMEVFWSFLGSALCGIMSYIVSRYMLKS